MFLKSWGIWVSTGWVVTIWGRGAFFHRDGHAVFLGARDDTSEFGGESDCNATRDEVFAPGVVEVRELGEDDHGWVVGSDGERVRGIPHAVSRGGAKSFKHHGRDLRGIVACAEEEGGHGQADSVGELIGEHPNLEEVLEGDEGEEDFEPAGELESKGQSLYFFLMASQKLGGKDIGPESIVLAKRDVEIDRVSVETLSSEHGQGVMKDVTSTLNTLVEPTGAMPLLVNGHREGLTATVIHGLDQSDVEFVGMLGEMVSGGHSGGTGTNDKDLFAAILSLEGLLGHDAGVGRTSALDVTSIRRRTRVHQLASVVNRGIDPTKKKGGMDQGVVMDEALKVM